MPVPFGVFAETGEFPASFNPATVQALRKQGLGGNVPKEVIKAKASSQESHFGMLGGELSANDLQQSGWAVLFAPGVIQEIKDQLKPLLDYRRNQVGDDRLFKVFDGPTGYQSGQTAADWLFSINQVTMNVVDPEQGVPFYVMIVGSPEEIPFEFQYELDLYWGVGRLWLDTPEDFGRYAHSLIEYETTPTVPSSKQMALFATRHESDNGVTQALCESVANPLVAANFGQKQRFALRPFVGETATKDTLNNIWNGTIAGGPPALLFTGSHGLLRKPDSQHLASTQGAIVCQEWPGGPPKPDHYFAARDISANAKVYGMVHFLLACYGGGWPEFDTFGSKAQISPAPMMSRLPQALLAHPNGSALGVLGHIDKAWTYSFQGDAHQPQSQAFRDVIVKIMSGYRLGNATDQFNIRWAALSAGLADILARMQLGINEKTPEQLANMWVARDDARNYVLHGDPAVRLRVNEMPSIAEPSPRP